MVTDSNSAVLAHKVQSVIPYLEPVKIENKLLNGAVHVQTVGNPARVYDVIALCTLAEWGLLTAAAATSAYLDVEFEGETLQGVIRDVPRIDNYTRGRARANRIYRVSFQLIDSSTT